MGREVGKRDGVHDGEEEGLELGISKDKLASFKGRTRRGQRGLFEM